MFEKNQQLNNTHDSLSFAQISFQLADVIYQLQKERGLSAGIIGHNTSFYKLQLAKQRQFTDASFKLLQQHFLPMPDYLTQQVRQKWDSLKLQYELIPQVRHKVDLADAKTKIFFEFYSQRISQIINIISFLHTLSSDVAISNMASSYIDILLIEENSGLERGAFNLGLSARQFKTEQLNAISSYIAGQQAAMRHFNNIAFNKHKKLLNRVFSHVSNAEVESFRSAFFNRSDRDEKLNRLQNMLGYGGFIQDFKNYVIRGDEKYVVHFKQKINVIKGQIDAYRQLSFLSNREQVALQRIQSILGQYQLHIKAIRLMHLSKTAVRDIDQLVAVDEKGVFDAVKLLIEMGQSYYQPEEWWRQSSRRLDLIHAVNGVVGNDLSSLIQLSISELQRLLWLYLVSCVMVFFVAGLVALKLRLRLVNDINSIVEALRDSHQKGHFDPLVKITGNDEIAEIVNAFNQLAKERDKSLQSLKLSAQVFTGAHEGIVITDVQGNVIDVNPAFCNMTGYSFAEMKARNPFKLDSDDRGVKAFVEMWIMLNRKGEWQGELCNHKKNGELIIARVSIVSLKDNQGNNTHYVALFSDISDSKLQQKELELLAHFDPLTRLPNRHLLNDRFNQAVAHENRQKTMLAVCFIDLDNFKPVNDQYGHKVGDQLLIEASQRIQSNIREEDTLSRLGGDEFVMLLGGINRIFECEQLLDRIVASIALPFLIEGHSIHISVSIGVTFCPLNDTNLDILIRYADQAMYQAKQAGRNCSRFFEHEPQQQQPYLHSL